jgi:prepilin-type processing-associated H-X9-DG protein
MTHSLPVELGGTPPTINIGVPAAFVDGHVKYLRLGFYQMMAILTTPNEIQ